MIRAGKSLTSTGEKAALVDLAEAINRMVRAFGVRGDAAALVKRYTEAMADLDVDDVIKALDRFTRQVVPAHDNRFEPNPVQVIAEVRRVNEMFRTPGRPERLALPAAEVRPRTDEERARADQILAAAGYGPKAAPGSRAETDEDRKRRAERMARDVEMRAARNRQILAEWDALGKPPMYADDAKTMPISPALAALAKIDRTAADLANATMQRDHEERIATRDELRGWGGTPPTPEERAAVGPGR